LVRGSLRGSTAKSSPTKTTCLLAS
jgi:hypothetical protein